MPNTMAKQQGHTARQALDEELSIALPADLFSQHRRATASTVGHVPSPASNGAPQRRRASAFTTPTPAARLLERFGINTGDVRSGDAAKRAQPAGARRPSAAGGVRETTRTQSGSNQEAQTRMSPHLADLLDGRPARAAVASPATPAWRPGGGGPRPSAAGAAAAPQSGGSFVSRGAAATAARARETSRQITGQGYASRLLPADGRDAPAAAVRTVASAGQVRAQAAGSAATPQRPGPPPSAGAKQNSAATPPRLQSTSSSPATLQGAARRASAPAAAAKPGTATAAARAGQGAASPLQPAGSVGSAAARTAPRALTYTEWLEAQAKTPTAAPQWRSPNDRTTSAAATPRGPSPQVGARVPEPHGATAGAAVPRTPSPITPITARTARFDMDTSSAYSTPTAHSPATTAGPSAVARRLLLSSNSDTRELSFFLEPEGDSDGSRNSAESGGGGGDNGRFMRLTNGSESSASSNPMPDMFSMPSLNVGGRLRIATMALADGGGGGGGGGTGSPAAGGSSRLGFPGAAAVAAADGSLVFQGTGTAAQGGSARSGGSSGFGAGQGTMRAGLSSPSTQRLAAAISPQEGLSARGATGRGDLGALARLAPEPYFNEEADPQRNISPAPGEGYKGVRLHDYLHHHRQQLSGQANESFEISDGGGGGGAATANRPAERLEYGISGTETGSEADDQSDGASILNDDMVRQASITGVMQLSPNGTLRRLSSRGAGGGPQSASAHVHVVRMEAAAASTSTAATAAGLASSRPQRSSSARGSQAAVNGVLEGPGEAGADKTSRWSTGGDPGGGPRPGVGVASAQFWEPPSQTRPSAGLGGSPEPWKKGPDSWDYQVQALGARQAAGSGDGGGDEAMGAGKRGGRGRGGAGVGGATHGGLGPRPGASGAAEWQRDGSAAALTTHGSAAAPEDAAPPFAKVRSFRLRMTSEWVPDTEDGSDRAMEIAPPRSSPRDDGSSAVVTDAAGGGARAVAEASSRVLQQSALIGPPQGPAARPGLQPQLSQAAEPPKPPLPPGSFHSASPGGTAAARAASASAAQPLPQQRQPHKQLAAQVPPPGVPFPTMQQQHMQQQLQQQQLYHLHQQQQLQLSSPTGRQPAPNGNGDDRQARSVSAPRGLTTSLGPGSASWGPPLPVSMPGGAARQASLSSLARELRDSVRAPGAGLGPGRGGWAAGSRGSAGQLLPRFSHSTLNSPASIASEAAGAGRGSISGASTFSALSGPQADVMFNYPSHGYMERAAEYGRWEAAMLYDLDVYSSMQLQGFPSPDEYDDPTYLTRSQSGLSALPPSGAATRPFAQPRPGSLVGASIGGPPPADSVLQGVRPRRMPPRRTVSASAAMLAAAAANAAAQAGAFPGAGLPRGSVLPRSLMRSSRSWSPLRFSSTAAGMSMAPGSPRNHITGDSMLDVLDQILEEESSGRLSTGQPEQSAADTSSPSISGGGAAGSSGSAAPPPLLPILAPPGSSPRELSLGAWPSFRRQSSYRRSGSSDGRLNFNTGGNAPYGSQRESIDDTQQRQQMLGQRSPAQLPVGLPQVTSSPQHSDALQQPLVAPRRVPLPPLLSVSETETVMQEPFPLSAAVGDGGNGSHQGYADPRGAMVATPAAAAPGPTRPQSAPPRPAASSPGATNSYDTSPSGQQQPQGTVHSPSHSATQPAGPSAVGTSPHSVRNPTANAAWPSPPQPPPHVPSTIPEEILSHPLSRLTLLSSYSSAAGSAVPGIAQTQRHQEQQQMLQQQLQEMPLQQPAGGGGTVSESGCTRGAAAAMAPPPPGVLPTGQLLPKYVVAQPLPHGLDVPASALLLAPSGSTASGRSGSSSGARDGSDHLAQLAAVEGSAAATAAAAHGTTGAAPLQQSYATSPADWLLRVGRGLSLEQPQLYQPGGGSKGTERALAEARHMPVSPGQQEFQRGPAYSAATYSPPSLEAIQRLLDTDLPSPAIAAAVAVLAGCLPQSWGRPPPPGVGQGLLSRRPDSAGRVAGSGGIAGPSSLRSAPGDAEAASLHTLAAAAPLTSPAVAGAAASTRASAGAWGADPDARGSGSGPGAGASDTGLPHEGAGRSGPTTQSYRALLTLAGERGMPPKPLLDDRAAGLRAAPEPPAPPAAGPAADGQAAECAHTEPGTGAHGTGHLVDGPLGRAVRLISQSLLIVLAGAAGATAAASSANAVFIRPEDLPYEHGTSIYYTKYPRNKRLAKALHR